MKRSLVILGVVLSISIGTWRSAQARPPYLSLYKEVFGEELKGIKVSCARCHEGDDKKKLNAYGEKLEKELGEKNVKDKEKIKEALKKIGSGIVPQKN